MSWSATDRGRDTAHAVSDLVVARKEGGKLVDNDGGPLPRHLGGSRAVDDLLAADRHRTLISLLGVGTDERHPADAVRRCRRGSRVGGSDARPTVDLASEQRASFRVKTGCTNASSTACDASLPAGFPRRVVVAKPSFVHSGGSQGSSTALEELPLDDLILDGEVVAFDTGTYQLLPPSVPSPGRSRTCLLRIRRPGLLGRDTTGLPLPIGPRCCQGPAGASPADQSRRSRSEAMPPTCSPTLCARGWEGWSPKRASSTLPSGRSPPTGASSSARPGRSWWSAGWTDPSGQRPASGHSCSATTTRGVTSGTRDGSEPGSMRGTCANT